MVFWHTWSRKVVLCPSVTNPLVLFEVRHHRRYRLGTDMPCFEFCANVQTVYRSGWKALRVFHIPLPLDVGYADDTVLSVVLLRN